MANVGRNIKKIRMRKKMTQDDLAAKLFVSRQTVSNYENNKSNPDIETLIKIAAILEVDANTLIYGETTPAEKKELMEKIAPRVLGGIISGIILYMIYIMSFSSIYSSIYFDIFSCFVVIEQNVIWPLWGCFVGWIAVDAICTIWNIPSLNGKGMKIIRKITIGFLVLYTAVILVADVYIVYDLIQQIRNGTLGVSTYGGAVMVSSSYEFTFDLRTFVYDVISLRFYLKPYLFIIPGVIIRMTRREKVKSEN